MNNKSLTRDYVIRAGIRLEALHVLNQKGGYADVVREAQEIVELLCKALVRHLRAEPARVHDVSAQLRELADRLPEKERGNLDRLIEISRDLRRDRELAFYGSEDLTPGEFYSAKDAADAIESAQFSVAFVSALVLHGQSA